MRPINPHKCRMPKWKGESAMIVIGGKYKDKISGEICTPQCCATCKDRGIEVIVYSGEEGERYTISVSEFNARFNQVNEIVLFKCGYNDIYSDMKGV